MGSLLTSRSQKTSLSHDSNSLHMSNKIALIGAAKTGKTSIVSRLVNNTFSTQYVATIGAVFERYENINIWDLAGQARYESMSMTFLRNINGIVVVFDLACEQSFDTAMLLWERYGRAENTDGRRYLVGNKYDVVEWYLPNKAENMVRRAFADIIADEIINCFDTGMKVIEAKNFALKNGFKYYEVSAKNGFMICELFQDVQDNFMN